LISRSGALVRTGQNPAPVDHAVSGGYRIKSYVAIVDKLANTIYYVYGELDPDSIC
jgi:hypothetical protein